MSPPPPATDRITVQEPVQEPVQDRVQEPVQDRVQEPVQEPSKAAGKAAADNTTAEPRWRRVRAYVLTGLAALLLLSAFLLPHRPERLTLQAFARVPLEPLLGVALLLVLPVRVRRPLAGCAGAVMGLVTVIKMLDLGFYSIFGRAFNLVLDWVLVDDGMSFLADSIGRAGAIGVAAGVVALVATLTVLMTLSALRLAGLLSRHRVAATRGGAIAAAAWITCAAMGAQLVTGLPMADRSTLLLLRTRAEKVHASLTDQRAFAKLAGVDAFAGMPSDQLLSGLRGKNVVLAFVESYGRTAVEDPRYAEQVGAVLDSGAERLRAAGFDARSAYLTSPTAGGGSWLAHATMRSGLWINNQQRYRTLMASDRLTLPSAFRRANWQTTALAPGIKKAWPEASFYGYERVYGSEGLGYRGPKFGWATMPDQYALEAFHRRAPVRPGGPPTMTEMALVSSHAPWAPLPTTLDWDKLGDGSVYHGMMRQADSRSVVWRSPETIRAAYGRAIGYSLDSLISYVERYRDDDLVLVFLGDHQPAPVVTGAGATRDVPVTIVARDPAVFDQISGWGWQEGLKPGPQAPVWRMDSFRDRFLTTFSSRAEPPGSSSHAAR